MGSFRTPEVYSYIAEAADLAAKRGHIVKHGTSDEEVLLCGAGENGIGSIMTEPVGEIGEAIEVQGSNGGGLVKVAAAIARGAYFISDAAGKAVVTGTRDVALGMIDESADAADQLVACVWF